MTSEQRDASTEQTSGIDNMVHWKTMDVALGLLRNHWFKVEMVIERCMRKLLQSFFAPYFKE